MPLAASKLFHPAVQTLPKGQDKDFSLNVQVEQLERWQPGQDVLPEL